jgi:hypothetical protein
MAALAPGPVPTFGVGGGPAVVMGGEGDHVPGACMDGKARPLAHWAKARKEIAGVPGQRVVLPEGLGESKPMPLPHIGLPEDSTPG